MMSDRERDAIELLERIYNGKADRPLHDDGMVTEWIDEEIMAFIRKHGPFATLDNEQEWHGFRIKTDKDMPEGLATAVPPEQEKTQLASLAARHAELMDLLSQARVGLGDYGNPADEVLLDEIDVALGEKR